MIKNRAVRLLLTTNSLILLAMAMLGPIYALFVQEVGGDILDAGLAGFAFGITAGIVSLFSGKLTDKIAEDKIIVVVGYTLIAIGFFSYLFVDNMKMLLISQIILGFGEAVYSPAFDSEFSRHLDDGESGVMWGVWESLNYFTAAGGALIAGALVQGFGYNPLFIIMGALSMVAAIYVFLIPKKVL